LLVAAALTEEAAVETEGLSAAEIEMTEKGEAVLPARSA